MHGHGLGLSFLLRQEGTLYVHECSGLEYDSRHQTAQDGHGHDLDAWWQRGRSGNTGNRRTMVSAQCVLMLLFYACLAACCLLLMHRLASCNLQLHLSAADAAAADARDARRCCCCSHLLPPQLLAACCRCILQSAAASICCRRSRRNTLESSGRQQRCELQHRQNQNHNPVYNQYRITLGVWKGLHHPRIIQELGSEYHVACGCAVPLRPLGRRSAAQPRSTPPRRV